MTAGCPIAWDMLLAYQLGELSDEDAASVELHYFECATCTERCVWLDAFRSALRGLIHGGAVGISVPEAFVERAEALGIGVRTYRLAEGDTVYCTAGPSDDFVVVRLSVDAGADEDVDLVQHVRFPDTGRTQDHTLSSVVVDRSAREVIYAFAAETVRSFPRTDWDVELRVSGPSGSRSLGPFMLRHTPWEQLPPDARI